MTTELPDAKADCYAAGERAMMAQSQQLRAQVFQPVLNLLSKCGVRPDHLTFLSLACGLSFCPAYLCQWTEVALVCMVLHVLLDGLDGPLARQLGVASRRGSFVDSTADQIVVAVSMFGLMSTYPEIIGIWAGGVYVFLYTLVVAFAMVRNAMGIPYSWLLRPRLFVYLWIPVEIYLWPGTLEPVVWLFNVILGWKAITGFRALCKDL